VGLINQIPTKIRWGRFYLWLFSHLVDEKSFLSFRHSPVFTGAGSAEAGIQSIVKYFFYSSGFLLPQE
jgi:hypothetical protein